MDRSAVLEELLAGILLGMSVGSLVDPKNEVLHLLAELVVVLLFEIGSATDPQNQLERELSCNNSRHHLVIPFRRIN